MEAQLRGKVCLCSPLSDLSPAAPSSANMAAVLMSHLLARSSFSSASSCLCRELPWVGAATGPMMSPLLFWTGVSSLAAATEGLPSKCQGTSGWASYRPGAAGAHSHYIWGKDLGRTVVALTFSIFSIHPERYK